ncbi:MAG: HlyD family secretion protein [Chloroflexi bacterium]|nr:MAG: HlyD family secretion protein [Chloroflexota bacterium]
MRRIVLINLIVVLVILVVAGVGGYLLYNNYFFYSTDDAQVNGNIVNIVSTVPGTLNSLTVKIGDYVGTNQVIGTVKATGSNAIANLTAPFSGVMVQVPGVVGQTVSPGIALALEADPSSVDIIAYVDESAIKNVSVGQFVDVHVDAYSGTSFKGHVSQIVGAAASQFSLLPTQDNSSGNFTKVSQRIPVIIALDSDSGQALLPGMSAEVVIHLH